MLNNVRHPLRMGLIYLAPLVLCLQVTACRHVPGPNIINGGNPPQIIFFEADPTQITAGSGQMITLKWETANAVKVRISGLDEDRELPPSGFLSVTPQRATTYTLIAANSEGRTKRSDPIRVTVDIRREVPPRRPAPVERAPGVLRQ
jgi:hypothetical protein